MRGRSLLGIVAVRVSKDVFKVAGRRYRHRKLKLRSKMKHLGAPTLCAKKFLRQQGELRVWSEGRKRNRRLYKDEDLRFLADVFK